MIQKHRFVAQLGEREIAIETGTLALQAGGAVTVHIGDTVVFATATGSRLPREGVDFFPLTVDYEERLYAAGKIPGSFFRREGRPSESAILLNRLVDRPLRPLFPKGFRNDVQIILTALSADQENYMDIPAIIGASAALMISDVPFGGPVGAVRIGYVDGAFVVNPTTSQMEHSTLDLRVGGTEDAILMVEAGADEIPEDVMLDALRLAHESMQPVIRMQKEMAAQIGKAKMEYKVFIPGAEVVDDVTRRMQAKIATIVASGLGKGERSEAIDTLRSELVEDTDEAIFDAQEQKAVFDSLIKQQVRARILDEGLRPDGRKTDEIRPISAAAGILPRTHGCGLFQRGETQVLTIATLGTPREAQTLDTLQPEETKRYMHHYNFPPYSTGEVYPMRGPKRREIGHGALAERALAPMIPPVDQFPYTLRLVSEVLSSNGSTSMASVCGSTLALMDAGVPILAPVAGIAMGLITDADADRFAILSDIQGVEDALGDMDFKVAGTRDGITALQMDMKIKGLRMDIMEQALEQARQGRLFILGKMLEVLPEPRASMSQYAPRIITIHVDPEKIGKIIGPGGKMIRAIQEEYNVKIDIEDDGSVFIASSDGLSAESAVREIESLTEEVTIGKTYVGRVVRTESYGAFVQILPGVDGLVHISQLADYRAPTVEDVVRVGDEVMVMVIDIDDQGKIRLSRQAVLEGWTVDEARARDTRGRSDRGGDRGGSRGPRPGGDRDRGGRNDRGGDRRDSGGSRYR
jgi:polyribonucleotide nucleotidyltransferase